ncbi:MAG: hypothetical protein HYX60_09730, partial [Legionella longbeachae]|nr:hypothetical protein [Legionella longbeachae]
MQYAVTFCVFDHTVGGNPAWHGSFFLSQLDKDKKLLEVVDTWGFYGVTTTTDPNSCSGKLKTKYALNVDFSGNHGMYIHEEVRFMDLGHGLHGYTFELTQEQFEKLQKKCTDEVLGQESAIKEYVSTHPLKIDPKRKVRIYKEEAYSKEIFEEEQSNAIKEKRSPRLKPFNFISWGTFGPTLKDTHTCKTGAIDLLEGILTEKQLAPFKDTFIPRFIPGLEPVFLHSTGPLRTHTRNSGKTVFYRDKNKDEDVKLYWSLPPQRFDALSKETKDLLTVDEEYIQESKSVVSKLQGLEWLIRNATLPDNYKDYKNDLIQRIIDYYRAFSIIEPHTEPKISGIYGFTLSLFSAPRSKNERIIQNKIKQAKMLFNSLYMAIVDGWNINDEYPSETSPIENAEGYNPLEALAIYLSEEEKKE